VLDKLLHVGNEVLITTKPNFSIVDGIIRQFGEYLPQIQFRFTITSMNNTHLAFWEPNAPLFEERFNSLILAYNRGYKTSVSVEPFLDSDPSLLMRILSPYITESIWLGPMNYIQRKDIKEDEMKEYERIRTIYSIKHLKKVSTLVEDIPHVRLKDSFVHKIGDRLCA
jgi:DNA repair photolyase